MRSARKAVRRQWIRVGGAKECSCCSQCPIHSNAATVTAHDERHTGWPQGFNTVKLVFISLYLYYDYHVNFDWCRKVQLHGDSRNRGQGYPEWGPCTSGLFFPGVHEGRTPGKNSPEVQGPHSGYP